MTEAPGQAHHVSVRRPQRADARRNFDALLGAAREVFAEEGTSASLEEVARRAGVGIGTLYRNFPTRQDLFETVYVDEVEALARRAEELTGLEPWAALVAWLRQFVSYATTKRAIYEALNRDSAMFAACREIMYSAGRPLLQRAQADGQARPDVSFEDVLRLISGISGSAYSDDEQRERVLTMALDGIRPRA
ncbi:TetR family transcriptional regulator [Kineosporia sp. NBRC 101677]|uniref:TetR/AcrR family transcriptional regulator n=1 Tax=Kineosporia sp. NBRC 101677 TaxID=3032197 RepID=UPI00249F99E3|nr:TetR/AcrR family transcriptional regulator [Kineosporia sp. NBRC 101677]GLY19846.1 TetR family transcriptional regulator [Kineosporia sp. NBRC 101677]